MSERRVNVRLQAIGADGVKRELADVGASGKASLSQIGDGAKKAGEGMQQAGEGARRFDRAMRSGTTRNIAQQLNQVAQSGMASSRRASGSTGKSRPLAAMWASASSSTER